MIIRKEKNIDIQIENIHIEQVKNFKYLGVEIENEGKQETEINKRIENAIKRY